MNKRQFRLIGVAAALCMAILVAATPELRAQKQNPNCCKYSVTLVGILDKCLPITITTEWGFGLRHGFSMIGPGPVYGDIPGKCPPASPFNWVSLDDGLTNFVFLGQTGKYVDPKTGCCYKISAGVDADGCVSILIFPCW